MRGNIKRICLNLFIILAVIGAGISPACKFISGQTTWMEICGVDGMKKILLPSEDAPQEKSADHAGNDPCAFCLTHSNVKTIAAQPIEIARVLRNVVASGVESATPVVVLTAFNNFFPRGPPIIL